VSTIVVTPGIALARRAFRDVDRVVMVYTRDLGKVRVRFRGVDRPKGKLKAFAEPMVRAEYRLCLRGDSAVAAGGALQAAHPRLRRGLKSTALGLYFCELLLRITAERDPHPELYDLLSESLRELDSGEPSPWLGLAYTLRLLQRRRSGASCTTRRPPRSAPCRGTPRSTATGGRARRPTSTRCSTGPC
jgi:DNA repair protein RecO (recombination protein O)